MKIGKLGKHKARHDIPVLRLAKYLTTPQLIFPPARKWSTAVPSYPMFGNDSIGDCVIAAVGHMIQTWCLNNGVNSIPTMQQIIEMYSAISGYNPSTGSNDNGCDLISVLNYWRDVGIGGHQISGYVAVNPQLTDHVKFGANTFGGLFEGVQLPESINDGPQGSIGAWVVPDGGPVGRGAPGSLGGHGVTLVDYDDTTCPVVTWGAVVSQSYGFLTTYCDELFAVLSMDWLSASKVAPSGFDLAALQADLAELAS